MSYNDRWTTEKAEQLFANTRLPTDDESRKAVLAILDAAQSAAEAASLLAMLDLYDVAEQMLTEQENRLFEERENGGAA